MRIGEKIRNIRKEQNITLEELAQKSGVALATLSRIENNRMPGTIDSHVSIAKALGASITELYSDVSVEEKKAEAILHTSPADIFVHTEKASFRILTTKALSKKMMPIMLNIHPDGSTNKDESPRGTEKFLYVLDGQIEALIGKDSFTLCKNDSVYFDATAPHIFKNSGTAIATAICVICPPAL